MTLTTAPPTVPRAVVRAVGLGTMRIGLTLSVLPLVAACSGGGASPGTTSSSSQPTNQRSTTPRTDPGVFGEIAEIDGNTLQVQNAQTGQVAVKVSSATTYTQTKSATRAAVTVGSCVVATELASSGSNSSAATPSPEPSGPRSITATTVLISPAVNGSCALPDRGQGGPQRGTTGNFPSGFPTNRPSGAPSGAPNQLRSFGTGVAGVVTTVHGNAIMVKAQRRASNSTTPTTVIDTITVTPATTYTATVAATKAALKVGLCADATGQAGSDGTVAARRIALSTKGANGCDRGFSRLGPPGSGSAGGPNPTVTSSG